MIHESWYPKKWWVPEKPMIEQTGGWVHAPSLIAAYLGQESLDRAAATRFGPRASVYTTDSGHERLAGEKLCAGCVLFNLPPTFRMDAAPFGGLRASGQGLEGPRWAMESYTEPRMIVSGPVV